MTGPLVVAGDAMLDIDIDIDIDLDLDGRADRLCPEAPVPVVERKR